MKPKKIIANTIYYILLAFIIELVLAGLIMIATIENSNYSFSSAYISVHTALLAVIVIGTLTRCVVVTFDWAKANK